MAKVELIQLFSDEDPFYWVDEVFSYLLGRQRGQSRCHLPGDVQTDQPDEFLEKVTFRIPMGRMARKDEHKGAILFLVSDASSYMTGATLIIDGGRTCW